MLTRRRADKRKLAKPGPMRADKRRRQPERADKLAKPACCRPEGGIIDRIDYFERMLADNPDNPTGLLALANEYGKAERYEDEAAVLQRYVATHEDEGNAWGRLGEVLARLGREDEAREAYARGIGQAEKHGHSGMADELRAALVNLSE